MSYASLDRNRSSAGHPRRINGSAGEGLFQYLAAYHWRAEFVPHGNAQGTDAHLKWPHLRYVPNLLVQVKSTTAWISAHAEYKSVWLEASEIEGWAAHEPILVLCDLRTARAWWLDTAASPPPFALRGRAKFEVPLANRVDGASRDQIQRIALRRWYHSIDYPNPPRRLRNVLPDNVQGVVEDAYAQIANEQGHDRDVIALAVTRFLQMSPQRGAVSLDKLISPMVERARLPEQGGRSYSLTALLALLLPLTKAELRTDLAFKLADIADFAVPSPDFVHPEFGLLIAAKLAEAGGPQDMERFRALLDIARDMQHTPRFHAVVQRLDRWLLRDEPLIATLGAGTMAAALTRRSNLAVEVFNRRDEARGAVARAIELGSANVSTEELLLIDHWTRYRADQFVAHHLGRALFSIADR